MSPFLLSLRAAVLLLSVLTGTIACTAITGTQTPSDVVRSWLAAAEKADVSGFAGTLSSKPRGEFEATAREFSMSLDKALKTIVDGMAQEMAQKGGVNSIEFTDERITGDAAEVEFAVRFARTTDVMVATLVKETGSWKIENWRRR